MLNEGFLSIYAEEKYITHVFKVSFPVLAGKSKLLGRRKPKICYKP